MANALFLMHSVSTATDLWRQKAANKMRIAGNCNLTAMTSESCKVKLKEAEKKKIIYHPNTKGLLTKSERHNRDRYVP